MRYPRQYYLLHFQCTLRIYCYINHLLYDMYRKARSAPNSDIALRPTEIPESRRYCGGKKGCVLAFRLRLDSDRATKIACTITKGKQDEMKPRSLCWFVVLLSRLVHNTHSININGWAHAGGKKASQGERGPAVAEDWRWSRALMSGQLWVRGVDRLWRVTPWALDRGQEDGEDRGLILHPECMMGYMSDCVLQGSFAGP